jgi:prepilin-type N-terminal cleavage/methylation domain-containing protein
MRNERGLTLIELLAALAISTVILGASVMLFTSVSQMFNNKVQNYTDEAGAELALNTIAKELTGASEVIHFPGADVDELRWESDTSQNHYRSLIYTSGSNQLILYDFTGSDADFKDTTINKATHPERFTRPRPLAHNVISVPIYNNLPPRTVVSNGALLELAFTFQFERVAASGKRDTFNKEYTTQVKLIRKTSK